MPKNQITQLHYFHDPMCSWCWAYQPSLAVLERALKNQLRPIYHVGGLAPDSSAPMPEHMRTTIQDIWRRIHAQLGTPFNFDFWANCTPRRSTYPACRAVLVAKHYGREREMINAIQHAYYLQAKNPSDHETLVRCAQDLHIDADDFERDLKSHAIERQLQQDIQFARSLNVPGFPSWVLEHQGQWIHIDVDYVNPTNTLEHIHQHCQ